MQSDKFPIEIQGQKYNVEETFSGLPCIYYGASYTHKGHITEGKLHDTRFFELQEEDIIIIARQAT